MGIEFELSFFVQRLASDKNKTCQLKDATVLSWWTEGFDGGEKAIVGQLYTYVGVLSNM